MKNPIYDFFYFPKHHRRTIVLLGSIAVFCLGVIVVIDATKGSVDTEARTDKQRSGENNVSAEKEASICFFDPNTVDSITLVNFGIKPWKVRNFIHYRAAGKVFRSTEDVGKTYGWDSNDVEKIAPYVRIDETYITNKQHTSRKNRQENSITSALEEMENRPLNAHSKFRTITKIDANTSDSTTLCRIPGIGEGISSAILRYRTRLGGFYSTQQLLEISIFSPELLEWFTIADTFAVKKLPINHASFQSLNSHPYITYDQTRNLLKYIRLYGNIDNERTLLSTGIFTTEEIERLRPYIQY